MVKLKNNISGSTIIETLTAFVIVTIALGLSVTFLSNKPYSKNLKTFSQFQELKSFYYKPKEEKFQSISSYKEEEIIFQDSLCLIKKISINGENLADQSVFKVYPIPK